MPDLSIENYRVCKTVTYFSTTIGNYIVDYTLSTGWHCSCPGFKYRKDCKHVAQAIDERCYHGWEALAASPADDWTDDNKCPKCGGDTDVIRVGV